MSILKTLGTWSMSAAAAAMLYSASADAVKLKRQGYVVPLGETEEQPVHERKKKEAAAPGVEETHEAEPEMPPARTAEKRAGRRENIIRHLGVDYIDGNKDGKLSAQEVINHWYDECRDSAEPATCAYDAARRSGWRMGELLADREKIVYGPPSGRAQRKTEDKRIVQRAGLPPTEEPVTAGTLDKKLDELGRDVTLLMEGVTNRLRRFSELEGYIGDLREDRDFNDFSGVLHDAYRDLREQKKDMESWCASAAKVPAVVQKEAADLERREKILFGNYVAAQNDSSLTTEQKKEKEAYYNFRLAEARMEYQQKITRIQKTVDNCKKSQADYDRAERELRERMVANLTRTDHNRMVGLDARAQLLYHGAAAASLGGSVCVNTRYFGDFCAGADALAGGESTSTRALHETPEVVGVAAGVERRSQTEGTETSARRYMAGTHARWNTPTAPLGRNWNASLGVELDLLLGSDRTSVERTRTSRRYSADGNQLGEAQVAEDESTSHRTVHSLVPSLRLDFCHTSDVCAEIGFGVDVAGQAPFGSAGVLYRWK